MEAHKADILKGALENKPRIVITSHTRPDGDAVGSALALHHYFIKKGFSSQVILPDKFPAFLDWLEGSSDILIYNKQKKASAAVLEKARIVFSVDYNDLERTNSMKEILKASGAYKVMIDHHPDPDEAAFHLTFSYPGYSSTSEIIYYLIQQFGDEVYICKHIAEALFAGILTDTGSFRHSSTRKETFEAVAHLIEKGVDVALINHRVYDTYSEKRLSLLGFCLSERLVVLPEYSAAFIYLTEKDLERFDYRQGDTEGLVNYGLSVEGINLAVLFTEKNGEIRLSLRSKVAFSVNDFARKHFSGGGHDRAAGATSTKSMEDTITYFRSLLPQYKEQLNAL